MHLPAIAHVEAVHSRHRDYQTDLTNQCSEPLAAVMTSSQRVYEVRPRKGKRGVDLISNVLPFGRLWYGGPEAVANAMGQR